MNSTVITACSRWPCLISRAWGVWAFCALLAFGSKRYPARVPIMVCLLTTCFLAVESHGLTIELNYDYDTNGFFDNSEVRQALEFAVQAFTPFTDQLLEIKPDDGGNSWTARIDHPGLVAPGFPVTNPAIEASTLLIFAGGRDLLGTQVGLGGRGRASPVEGTTAFKDIVRNRGQGITNNDDDEIAVDYGPWGGSISFDTTEPSPEGTPRDWHYGIDTAPSTGQTDFLSIAVHELAHVLGFGLSDVYDNQISGSTYQGPATTEINGGIGVPVVSGHWVNGTRSPPYADPPLAAMNGSIVLGSRIPFTPLDYAALKDIGWEVPDALLGLPGDINSDLDVDGSDFMQWQRYFGVTSGASLATGDLDGDHDVDRYDGWILRRNLGMVETAISQAAAFQVPEPATTSLCLSGFLVFLALTRIFHKPNASFDCEN